VIGLLEIAVVIVFPAVALLAMRGGGRRRLALITAITLAIIVAGALVMSSARFGNALAADRGYASVAGRVVLVLLLTAGLPVLSAAVALGALARRTLQPGTRYAIAVVAAAFGLGGGVLGSFALMWG
jgi:hypothetical protein